LRFWRLFSVVSIAVLLTFSSGCSRRVTDHEQISPAEKIIIKFSHVVAENTPKGLAAKRFANLVQERTNGLVEVQVYPNSTLFKDGEEIEALKDGSVQIIAPTTAKIAALFPHWQIFDVPYLFSSREAVFSTMAGPVGAQLFSELQKQGFQGLAFWDNGFKQMTNSVRPLVRPADFQGLRMRVMMGSKILEEQFLSLGADPVQMGFDQLYAALKEKRVDGQENTISNIYSKKFYEVQPYLTLSNHGYMGYVVLTNQKFWASLPANIREILENTMAEVTIWEREQAARLDKENFRALVATKQLQIHELTAEERKAWQQALAPVYRRAEEIVGKDLLETVLRSERKD